MIAPQYVVLWDGTPATSRQLCVPEEVRQAPPPVISQAPRFRCGDDLVSRVYRVLEVEDASTAQVAWTLRETAPRIHSAISNLLAKGVIERVDTVDVEHPFPGQRSRTVRYGVR